MNIEVLINTTESWDNKIKDIGNIESKVEQRVSFKYFGTKKIKRFIPSCSCTSISNKNNNEVTLIFTPSKLSPQTKKLTDHYELTRKVTVNYVDNTRDELIVKAKVYDKLD